MNDLVFLAEQITNQMSHVLCRALGVTPDDLDDRDRGAVSLEQVLWFVAAGVSVAVIAGILWTQIKDKADDPITPPVAP